jgi:hypothetical protein
VVEAAVTAITPQFHGLDPWLPNIEIIECSLEGRSTDLHNECTLDEVAITCVPALELMCRFKDDVRQVRFDLAFMGVQQLEFSQDDRAATPAG